MPTSGTLSITTTAKKIEIATGSAGNKRSSLIVYVPTTAANPVFIGGSNVTTSNGTPLAAGERITFTNDGPNGMAASQDWYAIVAATSVTVQITEAF